ncbi:fumarylacetoacetate hydrolase family protein [Streptomyces malaysiensis]|uniref:fumarylacetoacetate hydrolase family protein n=1 Tax=Streptomyces malaysiensis TaxID=92644 RepID=UPI002B2AC71D|nr:fumarylacetoacetate hydrolase family protein [Streptomyces malaysiensis]
MFNKYVSDLTGPVTNIRLSPANVDWEVEMVAVVGIGGRHISEADGWAHIAGLTLGQDISDRVTQFAAPPTQFGLAKSYPGYSPIGPFLVTIDELQEAGLNLDDLELGCEVNGRIRQKAQTKDLIFSVPALVARISEVVTLIAGDIIFTGTPSGVGMGMTPPQYLKAGDELISWCEGIGEMRHHFIND